MPDFPDINVWLALSLADHVHYARAIAYWDHEAVGPIVFNTVTVLGLTRLLTTATAKTKQPILPAEAWRIYEKWQSDPRVIHIPDSMDGIRRLGVYATAQAFSPSLWTDAYLAAFAKANGCRFVSFDRDILRFSDVDKLLLTA